MSAPAAISRGQREQRTLLAGAIVVAAALVIAYAIVPFMLRWRQRDAELDGARLRLRELSSLVANAPALDSAARMAERSLESGGRRVFRARSMTLAASALQSFLQDASDASSLVVTRLDVADAAEATSVESPRSSVTDSLPPSGTTSITATLSAHCDIAGLARLLAQFEHGPRVVHVERMTVQQNSALRGAPDMLQITLTVRAPAVIE
jgi:hypothetical protein